jgi:hypothetical protein
MTIFAWRVVESESEREGLRRQDRRGSVKRVIELQSLVAGLPHRLQFVDIYRKSRPLASDIHGKKGWVEQRCRQWSLRHKPPSSSS